MASKFISCASLHSLSNDTCMSYEKCRRRQPLLDKGQRRTHKCLINLTLQVHSLAHDNIQYIMPIYAKKDLSHFIVNFNVMQFHSILVKYPLDMSIYMYVHAYHVYHTCNFIVIFKYM